jgi:hypothetical protein
MVDDERKGEEDKSFSCRTDNIKSISDILNSLYFEANKDQPCFIEASHSEITFIVMSNSKSLQARLILTVEIFEDYLCESDSVRFAINLTVFLDCLRLFGSSESTTATLSYSTVDETLNISLEEAGVITTCEIAALYSEDDDQLEQQSLFIAFRDSPEECQMILKSDPLRESVQELTDSIWSGSVRLTVSSATMKLAAAGNIGACEIAIPRTSEAVVSFQCRSQAAVSFSYPLRSFLFGMKALGVSKEVCGSLSLCQSVCLSLLVRIWRL